ncbi:serine protein kinase RIO [Candidatus Bathyarchaeota archaeon]|nr:MAG: serine protein kinase RIO [Candidatus Bathyarchaeota archaeon]
MKKSFDDKVRERLRHRERRQDIERRMRKKRSEDMQVLEEVFDKTTLMTIYSLMNKGYIQDIFGALRSGKESKLYWGRDTENIDIALKIYLTTSSEFKKGMQKYIDADRRFQQIDRSTKSLIYLWARKEFDNLKDAQESGVNVPKRIAIEKNILIMEFIGENGVPAPLLRESNLKDPERTFNQLIENITKLYGQARLVHGDLSEYNIMIWKNKVVIFDLSQAVRLEHPMAEHFLKRDLSNIIKYFTNTGIQIPEPDELYRQVVGENAD